MAGIAFPVIIHLWNNKQGKVLRIGSIALLEKGSRRQARSNRITQWWLLLLRCLLLLLLALLLSAPIWRIVSKTEKATGWMLGTTAAIHQAAYKTLTDSLLKRGYEWHRWQDSNYWDLFRAADREAPATLPFYIFTDRRQAAFRGERPVSGRSTHWFTTMPSADSTHQWIGRAWLCSPDSIRVLIESSRLTGTIYRYQMLPARPGASQSLQVRLSNRRLLVALDSQAPVMVDTAPLRIFIYADRAHNNDSRYVAGAIRAWQQFTRQNIVLQSSSGKDLNTVLPSDWIFWLCPTPPPANLPAHTILCYEPGRDVSVDTWMQGAPGVAISRRIEPDVAGDGSKKQQAIWKDGFGRPLLIGETRSGKRIFHYLSHFDPAWNGLVWSPRFPLLLQELLTNPALMAEPSTEETPLSSAGDRDLRVLDPEQIAPQKSLPGSVTNWGPGGRPLQTIDLAPACWILILLVFVAERILSFRSSKIKTDG